MLHAALEDKHASIGTGIDTELHTIVDHYTLRALMFFSSCAQLVREAFELVLKVYILLENIEPRVR